MRNRLELIPSSPCEYSSNTAIPHWRPGSTRGSVRRRREPAARRLQSVPGQGLGLTRTSSSANGGHASGNQLPDDSDPIAMAYAGHQFGNFVPQLGDGRAFFSENSKGATVFSATFSQGRRPHALLARRRWPRRAGPMLREYLISERCMHLGSPPPERWPCHDRRAVFREQGAARCGAHRVGRKHVRVGTFQYFAPGATRSRA